MKSKILRFSFFIILCLEIFFPFVSPALTPEFSQTFERRRIPAQSNDNPLTVFLRAFANAPAQKQQAPLLLFGGVGHDVFLGCLNCSQNDQSSVLNEYGAFGNSVNSNSIFNSFGQYGSQFSSYSVCSEYASDPPVIVDRQGNFYGRVTLNLYHAQANKSPELVGWLRNTVCK